MLQAGTLAAQLQAPRRPGEPAPVLALRLGRRVPLEGAELAAWQEAQRVQQAQQAAAASAAGGDPSSPRAGQAASAEQPTRCGLGSTFSGPVRQALCPASLYKPCCASHLSAVLLLLPACLHAEPEGRKGPAVIPQQEGSLGASAGRAWTPSARRSARPPARPGWRAARPWPPAAPAARSRPLKSSLMASPSQRRAPPMFCSSCWVMHAYFISA